MCLHFAFGHRGGFRANGRADCPDIAQDVRQPYGTVWRLSDRVEQPANAPVGSNRFDPCLRYRIGMVDAGPKSSAAIDKQYVLK